MRKTLDITIDAEGRDKGKTFHLTEMPAWQAEKWATKALFLLARSGVDVPPDILSGGMQTIAVMGLQALLSVKFEDAEPLLDEMLACIQIQEQAIMRPLTKDDIEEIATYGTLRWEVLKLHVGFSSAGARSK